MRPSRLAFRREHTGNASLDRVQAQAQRTATALNLLPFADGVWVRNQVITGGADTIVNHGLGRKPQGYIVTRSTAGVVVFESAAASQPTDQTRQYALRASSTVTVDLWIF